MQKCIILLAVLLFSAQNFSCTQKAKTAEPEVKNIIFMIGDGMGLAHVAATIISQDYAPLNIERANYVGIAKTYSADNLVTDSAASGTALGTGTKTKNETLGVDPNGNRLTSTLEKAAAHGLATGLVATYSVTHATPGSFIGHVQSRYDEQGIAEGFIETDINVFFGAGKKYFTDRQDGRDLTKELEMQGYTMVYDVAELESISNGHVGGLFAPVSMPTMKEGRGDFLPKATEKALEILKNNSAGKGFFIMIEGSMIDSGGHYNDIETVIDETIDFDKAVKIAFDFADRNPGTLVVVTADHETGGLTMPSGPLDPEKPVRGVSYAFSTDGHTGNFVPIYSYGTGAENFTGIMENIDIPKIMQKLLKIT